MAVSGGSGGQWLMVVDGGGQWSMAVDVMDSSMGVKRDPDPRASRVGHGLDHGSDFRFLARLKRGPKRAGPHRCGPMWAGPCGYGPTRGPTLFFYLKNYFYDIIVINMFQYA